MSLLSLFALWGWVCPILVFSFTHLKIFSFFRDTHDFKQAIGAWRSKKATNNLIRPHKPRVPTGMGSCFESRQVRLRPQVTDRPTDWLCVLCLCRSELAYKTEISFISSSTKASKNRPEWPNYMEVRFCYISIRLRHVFFQLWELTNLCYSCVYLNKRRCFKKTMSQLDSLLTEVRFAPRLHSLAYVNNFIGDDRETDRLREVWVLLPG